MSTEEKVLDIDVVSDVMCPWCFIGKRRLERALATRPDVRVDIRWRPYQLDPTIPEGGMDRQTYLSNKFGPERARQVYGTIEEAGAAEGIAFAFDRIEKSPNTLNVHRLLRWAATAGVQNALVERLFLAYFINGEDLTDLSFLADLAEQAGMERPVVEELLAGDADKELVSREIALAQEMGVQGVPCFIFGNKYVVMGAQDPMVLVQAIDKALAEAPAPASDGAAGSAASG